MTSLETSIILLLTFGISVISWRFIETPFRSKDLLKTREIYSLAFGSIFTIALIAGGMYYLDGFLINTGIMKASKDERENEWITNLQKCNINYIDSPKDILTCHIGRKSSPEIFMIWGDSHAPTFGKGAHDAAQKNDIAGVITYAQGCPPYLGIVVDPSHGDLPCNQYNDMVIKYLEVHPQIQTVILVSRITLYLEGTPYKQEEGVQHSLTDKLGNYQTEPDSETLIRTGLGRTIQTLQRLGKKVVIIVPIPEVGYDVPSVNFIAARTGRNANQLIAPTLNEYFSRNSRTFSLLNDLKKTYDVQLLEPWKSLCQDDICQVVIDQTPLYLDDDHLSAFGSEFLTGIFEPLFASMKTQ
jgi:hypothetical protein